MDSKLLANTRIYTDIQSLNNLGHEYKNNPDAVKKEVAQQFEAILMQMVMSSMREANKAFASKDDGFSSDQMSMYQDMFDKQLSLMMSNSNIGFASLVENSIDKMQGNKPTASNPQPISSQAIARTDKMMMQPINSSSRALTSPVGESIAMSNKEINTDKNNSSDFKTPVDFVKKLWGASKQAAGMLGLNPEILLAQAALETNWGKKVIAHDANNSSHNLFNIKADAAWGDKTVTANTLEQIDGTLVKEKSTFRSYGSFLESFMDYVSFLKSNNRYSDALTKTSSPDQFMASLQKAGFATDPEYAAKVMKVLKSPVFKEALAAVE